MLDTLVASEGEPDLLQISGGEPTLHPQILEILRLAKQRPIRHLMLNTNGVRLANEPAFVEALAELGPGFEVYLRFDPRAEALENIRGADLRGVRSRALANLEKAGLSTTLVVVVKKGVNDQEVGEITRHALEYECVRGITFQPVQDAGRNLGFDKNRDRAMLTDIRRVIAETPASSPRGSLPLALQSRAIGYGARRQNVTPITQLIPKPSSSPCQQPSASKDAELKRRLIELLCYPAPEQTDPTCAGCSAACRSSKCRRAWL